MGKSLEEYGKQFNKILAVGNYPEKLLRAGKTHARLMLGWWMYVLYSSGHVASPTAWGVHNFTPEGLETLPRASGRLKWDAKSLEGNPTEGLYEAAYWYEMSQGYNKWYLRCKKGTRVDAKVLMQHGKVVFRGKHNYHWESVLDAYYGDGRVQREPLEKFYEPYKGKEDLHVAEIRKNILEYVDGHETVFLSDEFIYTLREPQDSKEGICLGRGGYLHTYGGVQPLRGYTYTGEYVSKYEGVKMGYSGFSDVLPLEAQVGGKKLKVYPVDELKGGKSLVPSTLLEDPVRVQIFSVGDYMDYQDIIRDSLSEFKDVYSLYIRTGAAEYQNWLSELEKLS